MKKLLSLLLLVVICSPASALEALALLKEPVR